MERRGNYELGGRGHFSCIINFRLGAFPRRGEEEPARRVMQILQVHVCNPLRKSKSIFLLNGSFKSGILMPVNLVHFSN